MADPVFAGAVVQTPTPRSFYAGCISGAGGNEEAYNVGAVTGDVDNASGWLYTGLADGSWVDSTPMSLAVVGDTTTVVCRGKHRDQIDCHVTVVVKGLGAAAIVGVQVVLADGSGTVLLDSVGGAIFFGSFLTV